MTLPHLLRPARLFSDSSSLITLPCKLLFPIRDQVPLLVALRGSPKPIILRSARRARSLHQYTVDHLYVRKDFYFAFCTFSFISLCFRPLALYSAIPSFTLAHLPFWTPHSLHPRYLYVYRSALDHISENLSLFRALYPLAIVSARVCRRQACLYIWTSLFPLSDFLVFISPWTLDLSRGICAPPPRFSPSSSLTYVSAWLFDNKPSHRAVARP